MVGAAHSHDGIDETSFHSETGPEDRPQAPMQSSGEETYENTLDVKFVETHNGKQPSYGTFLKSLHMSPDGQE